jgi:hypothetical protein
VTGLNLCSRSSVSLKTQEIAMTKDLKKKPDVAPSDDAQTPKPKKVRDAGPEAMKTPPKKWDDVDEQADESFPASDPPGNY